MDEVVRRLDGLGIPWEAWSDEAAPGQVELNFVPADAVTAADRVFRAKQVDQGGRARPRRERDVHGQADRASSATACTFTTRCAERAHRRSSTRDADDRSVDDHAALDRRSRRDDARRGSILAPTVNSYRRMVGFAAAPTTPTWGEENKSTGLRVISRSEKLAARRTPRGERRRERVPRARHDPRRRASRARRRDRTAARAPRPGLGRAAGLRGITGRSAWPPTSSRTTSCSTGVLGSEFVDYWLHSRRWEWLMFHTGGGDAAGEQRHRLGAQPLLRARVTGSRAAGQRPSNGRARRGAWPACARPPDPRSPRGCAAHRIGRQVEELPLAGAVLDVEIPRGAQRPVRRDSDSDTRRRTHRRRRPGVRCARDGWIGVVVRFDRPTVDGARRPDRVSAVT